jgi:hypothetical protein
LSVTLDDEPTQAESVGSQIELRPAREGRRVADDDTLAAAGIGLPELVAAVKKSPEVLVEAAKALRAEDRAALAPILFRLVALAESGEKAFKALKATAGEELDVEVEQTGTVGRGDGRYLLAEDEHGVLLRATRAKESPTTTWDNAKVATALAAYLPYSGPDPNAPFLGEGDLGDAFRAGAKAAIELAVEVRTGDWRATDLARIASELGRDDPMNAGLLTGARTRTKPKPGQEFKGIAKIDVAPSSRM